MSRRLRFLFIAIAALLLGASVSWYWLLHTASGATFVWSVAQRQVPGELSATGMQGDLSGGLQLRSIRFQTDDFRVEAADARIAVDVDLVPPSIEVTTLDVQRIDIRLTNGKDAPTDVDIQDIITSMRMPIRIVVADSRISDVSLSLPDREPLALISSLKLAGRLYDDLQIDQLELLSPVADLSLHMTMELQPPFAMVLQGSTRIKDVGAEGISGIELMADARGNAEKLIIDLSSTEPQVRIAGQVQYLFDQPDLNLRLGSSRLAWPIRSEAPEVYANNLDVRAHGSIENYEIDAAAVLALGGLGDMVFKMTGIGTPTRLTIGMVTVRGDRVDGSANGELDWSDGLALTTDIVAKKFDPRGWIEGWPEAHPLNGQFSGRWHGKDVDISRFQVNVAETSISVSGNGRIDTNQNVVDGELNWRGIQWPFNAESPAFRSSSGEITLNGKPSAWSIEGAIMLQARALPEGRLEISGNGDLDGIAFTKQDGDNLGGNARGHGNYRWRDNHPFTGSLDIDRVQTATIAPNWPGILSGDVDIDGTAQPFTIDVSTSGLRGEIRDLPVAVSGALSIASASIEFRGFDLTHGDSTVKLDGRLFGRGGVAYQLNLASIGSYTDAVSGSLEGSGTVSLHDSDPRLRGNLSARDLAIGGIEIAALQVEDNAVDNSEFINQRLFARNMRISGQSIESLSISAIGDTDRHVLALELQSEDFDASLEATGRLKGWQEMATVTWQGEVSDLQFEYPDELMIGLNAPATIQVSTNEIKLGQSCLDVERDKAICAHGHWIREWSIDAAAELNGVPVRALMLLADTDLDFTQELTGGMSWSSAGDKPTNAHASFEMTPGRIVSTFDTRLALETGKGDLGFQVADGRLGSGHFDLPFPNFGAIDIDFQVADLTIGADSPLSGHALIDLSDISILADLFPFIDSGGGTLASNLAVGGTLASPSIEGSVTLRDANLSYLPFGTTLSDLQVDATISEYNQVDLESRFQAGDGTGTITTSAAYESGDIPNLEFEIKGNNLLLIDDPEVRIIGDPDIKISLHDRALQLGGKLRVPEADIRPTVIPEAPVSESDDVTIVAGDHPDKARTVVDDQAFRMLGSLEVELGDSVSVDLGVATANLGGSVVFDWQDEFMPNARGSVSVNGTIVAVGQVLNVHDGIVSFPGVPADNPYLNIAAVRDIYGNSQVKTAGILLTGTVKNPVMEAFTYPLTTEERALTLLATGSDFDYEQGVGALDFGVYVAPRFYLSYGIGLFDGDSIIGARYDLKRGFGIKASSGQRESGVDLIYRLER